MIRNLIVDAFEAFAWIFFVGMIVYATWFGWYAADHHLIYGLPWDVQPWQGAVAGFVGGTIASIVVTGLIFTLLDIRAGTDRITYLLERELMRKYGDTDVED